MSDQRIATYQHIDAVRELMHGAIVDLLERSRVHDASKLVSPEREVFDEISQLLHGVTYGSDEYRATLRKYKPVLDLHVTRNTHHPEAHERGIHGMTMMDLLEMTCDWIAAAMRHADGDCFGSVRNVNMKRFGFGDELATLIENTMRELLKDKP